MFRQVMLYDIMCPSILFMYMMEKVYIISNLYIIKTVSSCLRAKIEGQLVNPRKTGHKVWSAAA